MGDPKATGRSAAQHTNRLVLEVNDLDPQGDQFEGPSTRIVVVEGIVGSPQGRATGAPGDLRVRKDVPEIWQKGGTGTARSKDGWVRVVADDLEPWIDASQHGVLPTVADNGPPMNALMAAVSAGTIGEGRQRIYVPPGTYNVQTTISHPRNVTVFGAGPSTIFQQVGAITLWDFQSGFLRSELSEIYLQGVGGSDPNDFGLRVGIGIDLSEAQQVILEDLQTWDFLLGLRLSDGTPFSSYHRVGPHVEINRCTTGISGMDEINASSIVDSRVFFSYGAAGEGIGVDIDDAQGFRLDQVAIEAADTCLRVRSSTGLLQMRVNDCFLEPGTNPQTLVVGSLYDINIANQSDGLEVLRMEGNVASGNAGDVIMPPEGFVYLDTYSRAFFGARYDGAAVPKRNLVFNGSLLNWALPDVLPGWAGGGTLPTLAQNQVTFVTGVRSMSVTGPGVTGSSIAAIFEVSDPGVEWVTCGVRYQVIGANVGFFFSGSVGSNSRQLTDPNDSAGVWQTRYVQVPVDPSNRTGSISINPDSINGTGEVLIDEVWAVAGRYAIPSTQHSDRILLLPAPIIIHSATGITGLDLFGPIDITDLPSLLSPPLDDFSAAPEGVVGGVFRLRLSVPGAASTGVLVGPFYAFLNIPGSGATTVAATVHQTMATFGQTQHDGEVTVRDTTISGGCVLATGIATNYDVSLVAWLVQ